MIIKSTKDQSPIKLNVLISGTSGSGKTTLAKTLTGKTLIISLESGLLSLKDYAIDYVEINGVTPSERYLQLKQTVLDASKSDYENIFFDSLTDIAQLFVDLCKEKFPDFKDSMRLWNEYNTLMTGFLKFTRDLPKNIFHITLLKTDKDEIGRRFNVPDMAGSIATKCVAMLDFVFVLRVFEKDGEFTRALLTSNEDIYLAKDRSGKLSKYEKPDLQEIINKVFQGESK